MSRRTRLRDISHELLMILVVATLGFLLGHATHRIFHEPEPTPTSTPTEQESP